MKTDTSEQLIKSGTGSKIHNVDLPPTDKDWLKSTCDICRKVKRYTEYTREEGSVWSVIRLMTIALKIIKQSNNLRDLCGYCGDILVAGEAVLTAISTTDLFRKTGGGRGELGLLNGVIRVYKGDMDPCEALIQYRDVDGRFISHLMRFEDLESMHESLSQENTSHDITSEKNWNS